MHRVSTLNKIFVSAYACEPQFGSEIGVGWHWVMAMSQDNELWVLTRKSNKKSIEAWVDEHSGVENIHWIFHDLPSSLRWWKKGIRGVRIYYHLWVWTSNGIVKSTMNANGIRIFHSLTYGNALWPVCRFGRKQKFIWGPIGGLETIPREFIKHYGFFSRVLEILRRLIVRGIKNNAMFIDRCRQASLILCKTESTAKLIPSSQSSKVKIITDVACNEPFNMQQFVNPAVIHFLTVGRLDAWRGFDLIIEAFCLLEKRIKNIHLSILGEGYDKKRLEKMIRSCDCPEKITMRGNVSREEYEQCMVDSDVLVNAALKEGSVSVTFDAISNGKPIVIISTGGCTRLLDDGMAQIVPLSGRSDTINGLVSGMERFCDSKQRENARSCCRELYNQLNWKQKIQEINDALQSIR